jgi:4-hydroxybenzoate polyprenyltransferase
MSTTERSHDQSKGIPPNSVDKIPLVVDLDGTLTPSDTLWESLWWLLINKPMTFFKVWSKLPLGKEAFKKEVFGALDANKVISSIPWNNAIVKYLEEENKRGREIVLATASRIEMAELIKKQFTFITAALASTDEVNLKGEKKAQVLIENFGKGGFDYIGNAAVDIHIWKHTNKALIASSLFNPSLQKKLSSNKKVSTIFPLKEKRFKLVLRALRVKQWSKNLLVFAPLIASHAYLDPEKWWVGFLTFLTFSLCASGAYMLNDLIDLKHDREHHKKSDRPIAQGYFSIPLALSLAFILPIFGLTIAYEINIFGYIMLYLLSTVLYSTWLKKIAIVDIACLAGLYCLRIVTGGTATNDPVSFWMAAFGGFLFVSLACIKRQAELLNLSHEDTTQSDQLTEARGRDYTTKDINLTRNIGVSTGCIAPLVLALYLEGNSGEQFYAHPEYLWAACGLIFIWIMSLWRDTEQGKLKDEDPISYSISNRKSIIFLLLLCITLILATYAP